MKDPAPTLPPAPEKPSRAGAPIGNKNADKGDKACTSKLFAYVPPSEKAAFVRAAGKAGLSWWIRDTCRRSVGLAALPRE